jgi:cytochrome c peroxidase
LPDVDSIFAYSSRTDYVLTQDKSFKKYAKAYAEDQDLFFKECVFFRFFITAITKLTVCFSFASVVSRLFELGVPEAQMPKEHWTMKSSNEQSS